MFRAVISHASALTVMSAMPGAAALLCVGFFFNDTATTEIYTLSLHDALPISRTGCARPRAPGGGGQRLQRRNGAAARAGVPGSRAPPAGGERRLRAGEQRGDAPRARRARGIRGADQQRRGDLAGLASPVARGRGSASRGG